jgi:hypothetical protein
MAALNTVLSNSERREVWSWLYLTKTVVALKAEHKDAHDLKGHTFCSRSRRLRASNKGYAGDYAGCRIILRAIDSMNSGLFIPVVERNIAFHLFLRIADHNVAEFHIAVVHAGFILSSHWSADQQEQ